MDHLKKENKGNLIGFQNTNVTIAYTIGERSAKPKLHLLINLKMVSPNSLALCLKTAG